MACLTKTAVFRNYRYEKEKERERERERKTEALTYGITLLNRYLVGVRAEGVFSL